MSDTKIELSENLKIVALFKANGKEISSLKFGEAKLKTGEVIMYDGETPTQGMAIAIQTPEGWLPVPDGVIELEDGTMIEVSAGLIASVKTAEVVAEPVAEVAPENTNDMNDEKNPLTPEQTAAVKRTIESTIKETHFTKEELEEKFNAIPKAEAVDLTEINTKLAKQDEVIESLTKSNTELKTQLSALVELLSKAPADKPAKVATNAFKASVEDQDAKIMNYLKTLNN